ncbi:MAG: hypothetical protein HQ567_27660 [Candidatus Nealsonbacteria bacterium]|nr:hypothetical protein [Candidatus Nealsonbacteria bacterium]
MIAAHLSKITLLVGAMLAGAISARGDLSPDQAKRIREAAPEKARVRPEKPRRVLIWNTPYMDKSPPGVLQRVRPSYRDLVELYDHAVLP